MSASGRSKALIPERAARRVGPVSAPRARPTRPAPASGMCKVAKQQLLKRLHTTPEPDTGPPPPLDLPPTPLPPDVREPAVPGQHPPVREPVWPGQSMSMAA